MLMNFDWLGSKFKIVKEKEFSSMEDYSFTSRSYDQARYSKYFTQ